MRVGMGISRKRAANLEPIIIRLREKELMGKAKS
jgi:hypothetical protein